MIVQLSDLLAKGLPLRMFKDARYFEDRAFRIGHHQNSSILQEHPCELLKCFEHELLR